MTEEQITELQTWWAAHDDDALRAERAAEILPRLLEERKRLLSAAKIEPHCCGQAGVREDHEAIEAAIAFAEEPSCVT